MGGQEKVCLLLPLGKKHHGFKQSIGRQSLKVTVIGDVHLIADSDSYKGLHDRREFFKSGWPSFKKLIDVVNDESPDLTILLGDLVDWFSPENIAFGLDLLTGLRHPWHMTPGNHDVAAPAGGFGQEDYATVATRDHLAYWEAQGVVLASRTINLGGFRLILLDSALSDLADGAQDWLGQVLNGEHPSLLFTHVPIDVPETRDYILSVDARRSMIKYVLSGASDLYVEHIQGRIPHVFSGHLHFAGDLSRDITRFHLCNMGISMNDPHRKQGAVASSTVIEEDGSTFGIRKIMVDA